MSAPYCPECKGHGFVIEHYDGPECGWQPGPSGYGREERDVECEKCGGKGVIDEEDAA